MKMYICMRKDVPDKFVPVCAAHASLSCYLKFKDHPDMTKWLNTSYRKVVCKLSESQFNALADIENGVVMTESSLGGDVVCKVFLPRDVWPDIFRKFSLWKPSSK